MSVIFMFTVLALQHVIFTHNTCYHWQPTASILTCRCSFHLQPVCNCLVHIHTAVSVYRRTHWYRNPSCYVGRGAPLQKTRLKKRYTSFTFVLHMYYISQRAQFNDQSHTNTGLVAHQVDTKRIVKQPRLVLLWL